MWTSSKTLWTLFLKKWTLFLKKLRLTVICNDPQEFHKPDILGRPSRTWVLTVKRQATLTSSWQRRPPHELWTKWLWCCRAPGICSRPKALSKLGISDAMSWRCASRLHSCLRGITEMLYAILFLENLKGGPSDNIDSKRSFCEGINEFLCGTNTIPYDQYPSVLRSTKPQCVRVRSAHTMLCNNLSAPRTCTCCDWLGWL